MHAAPCWRTSGFNRFGGSPSVSAATQFLAAVIAIAWRVGSDALAMCGDSTTFVRSYSPGLTFGSFS